MDYQTFKIIRCAVFGPSTKKMITCSTSSPPASTQAEPDVYMGNAPVNDVRLTKQTASVSINEQMPFDPTSQKRHRMDECRPLWLSYGKIISGSTRPPSEPRLIGPLSVQKPLGLLSEQRPSGSFTVQRHFGTLSDPRHVGPLRWLRPVGPLRWLRPFGLLGCLRPVELLRWPRAFGTFSRPRTVVPLTRLSSLQPLSQPPTVRSSSWQKVFELPPESPITNAQLWWFSSVTVCVGLCVYEYVIDKRASCAFEADVHKSRNVGWLVCLCASVCLCVGVFMYVGR